MAYEAPWSWVPPDWEQATAVQPVAPLVQPGQAMPEAGAFMPQPIPVAPPQQEIEMPAMEMRPEPFIGFPSNPDEAAPAALDYPVDAISGADPQTMPPPPAMQPGLGIPAHMLTEAAQGQAVADRDGYTMPPEPGTEGEIEFAPDQLTEADRKQSLAEMDGPEFAQFAAEQEEANRQKAAAELVRAAQADKQKAEDDYKIFQSARETARTERLQVEADAAKLANTQIDNDRWMNSRSAGQTIAAFISAIVGGLVAGRTGGRNDGLAMIERAIERDVEEQKANLVNQRNIINDRRGAAIDNAQAAEGDYRAESAFRAASWERTIRMIEADQQNYDPAGTSAIRLESARREAIAKQQAALMAFEEQEIKRAEALGKLNAEQQKAILAERKQIEDERNNRAQNRASLTSAGASYLTAKTNAKKTEAEIRALEAENTPQPEAELRRLFPDAPPQLFNGPMSLKQFKASLAVSEQASEAAKKSGDAAKTARENDPANRGAGDLVTEEGKILEFTDDQARTRVVKKRGAVDNAARIIDQMIVSIGKNGWSSDTVKSPEWLAVQSDAAALVIQLKNDAELGVLAGPDMGIMDKMSGGDPTQIRNPVAALKQARANIINNFNGDMSASARPGSKPKRYEPPKIEEAQAEERDQLRNMDAWAPPELLDTSVDPAIRKRAAARAVKSADALARQSEPHLIRQFAKENEQRLEDGLIDEAQAEAARGAFRKVYGRRIRDAARTGDGEAMSALGVTIEQVGEPDVDALLGIKKDKK